MTVRGFLSRVTGQLIAKGEGDYHAGPYYLPVTGGWLPDGVADNWWQQGYTPMTGRPGRDGRGLRVGVFADRRHVPGRSLASAGQRRPRAGDHIGAVALAAPAERLSVDLRLPAQRHPLAVHGRQRIRAGAAQRPVRGRRDAPDACAAVAAAASPTTARSSTSSPATMSSTDGSAPSRRSSCRCATCCMSGCTSTGDTRCR